ncbi:unnamed protein product [Gongylonema pulchrum]|uniref:BAR domain-containing protein n=1 Tax=Gongylonema pulchrum TaxID=637853 RepID=A0A183EVX2_9BILA|nr:unnamed protein product [Gongylonema pulchrum]
MTRWERLVKAAKWAVTVTEKAMNRSMLEICIRDSIETSRRNEPLEQKAAERLFAVGEYEKLVEEFVETLKKKHPTDHSDMNKMNMYKPKPDDGPGPDRNLSPDDAVIRERDQLLEEVNSLETSYCELFKRYEKLRLASIEIKQVFYFLNFLALCVSYVFFFFLR